MFQDVATIFNRQEGLWYPTALTGVQVQASEGAKPAALGGERNSSSAAFESVPHLTIVTNCSS